MPPPLTSSPASPPPPRPDAAQHASECVVLEGETNIVQVAQRLGFSEDALRDANPSLSNPDALNAGQHLRVPSAPPSSPTLAPAALPPTSREGRGPQESQVTRSGPRQVLQNLVRGLQVGDMLIKMPTPALGRTNASHDMTPEGVQERDRERVQAEAQGHACGPRVCTPAEAAERDRLVNASGPSRPIAPSEASPGIPIRQVRGVLPEGPGNGATYMEMQPRVVMPTFESMSEQIRWKPPEQHASSGPKPGSSGS